MLLRLILLLTMVPILELVILLQVHHFLAVRWGGGVGLLVTLGSIALTGIVGALLARHQGIGVLRNLRETSQRGEIPGGALLDGVMVLIGAALLLTPGFLTDAIGFSLLIPITRNIYRNAFRLWIRSKIEQGNVRVSVSVADDDNDKTYSQLGE